MTTEIPKNRRERNRRRCEYRCEVFDRGSWVCEGRGVSAECGASDESDASAESDG